jgi:two-component system, OmpR family, phosphate regulon sensor histidine kinase PhoR
MAKRSKLLWRLYPTYLFITVVSVAAMAWFAYRALTQLTEERTFADLQTQAILFEKLVEGKFSSENAAELDALLKGIRLHDMARATLVLPTGAVLADSVGEPRKMDDHDSRPETRTALKGRTGVATRYSFTANQTMAYVARPLMKDGHVIGVIRVAMPVTAVRNVISPIFRELAGAGVLILLLGAGVSLYVSYRISRTVGRFRSGAARFAQGDLGYRLEIGNSEEFAALAESMNEMAGQLHARLSTITQQRNELEAVLSGMVEAVLVLDKHERILRVNGAAERLLRIDGVKVRDRSIQEAVRNTDLHRFVTTTLASEAPVEGDIVIIGDPDKFLQAHGAVLRDEQDNTTAALVVLNDVSRLKALENIRRDFVANVSHELKTPITSIKGFLETLREGAVKDPENADRFLDIIIKHTDRLSAIIEDLLSLSRIERDEERGGIHLEEGSMEEVFEAVSRACGERAELKGISLRFELEEDIVWRMNPALLEQAVANLVDNAVKYSESGSSVRIAATRDTEGILISVEDHGCGISRDQIGRIFERFYRVDKARSRKEGGTGLGLSITKHIVNAHGGNISVVSSPGKGSTFSIHLPNSA